MHPGALLRLVGVRACAVAGVATIFGVMGHLHAEGGDPGVSELLAIWLATTALAAGFLIREAGWLRIAVLLLGEQLLVHTSLMWVAVREARPMSDMPGMAGMQGMHHMNVLPSPTMLAGHGVAAAVAALWLWQGERAFWALLTIAGDSLRVLLRGGTARPLMPDATSGPLGSDDLRPSWGVLLAREAPRRGPPAFAAQ